MEEIILLIGGNSAIGQAIAAGISRRISVAQVFRVSRTIKDENKVQDYILREYSNLSMAEMMSQYKIRAVIISFGVLASTNDYISDLKENFEVNVIEYLQVLSDVLEATAQDPDIEIHITSSVLADFERKSILGYSLSKYVMEKSLNNDTWKKKIQNRKIFIWKFAFVQTQLNSSRKKSIIFTNLLSIERRTSKVSKPGKYYVPKIAKIPAQILRHYPRISDILD